MSSDILIDSDSPIGQNPAISGSPRVQREPPQNGVTIDRVPANQNKASTWTNEPLNDTNWTNWHKKMQCILENCDLDTYVRGEIPRPNRVTDHDNYKAWHYNDNYAKLLITNNVKDDQNNHINHCNTSHEMWEALEAVHESRGHQTIISYIRSLIHTIASEEDNINDHLATLKNYWDRINQIADDNFKFSDSMFKIIISSSLPPAWDAFMEPYVGGQIGIDDNSAKHNLTSSKLIGLIKEEYVRRQNRNNLIKESTHTANEANYRSKKSLAQRFTQPAANPKPQTNLFCKHCKLTNHTVENCRYLGQNSCGSCGKYGHARKDCRKPSGNKRKRDNDDKSSTRGNANKRFLCNSPRPMKVSTLTLIAM